MNALAVVGSTREFIHITEDVTLVILKDEGFEDAGLLKFKSGRELEFRFDEDARQVFSDIDNADPIELLTVMAQAALQIK